MVTSSVLRFTDFLVFEIDREHNVVRLQNISKPDESSHKPEDKDTSTPGAAIDIHPTTECATEPVTGAGTLTKSVIDTASDSNPLPTDNLSSTAAGTSIKVEVAETPDFEDNNPWRARFTARLEQFLSLEAIEKLKQMFLEGPTSPTVSPDDSNERPPPTPIPIPSNNPSRSESDGRATKHEERRGRGGRGGREGRGGRIGAPGRERPKLQNADHRKVVSDVSKIPQCDPCSNCI